MTNLSFFVWFERTLFYRRAADTSPCPGSATTPATADASYTTTLPNARKIRCIRRRRSRKLSNLRGIEEEKKRKGKNSRTKNEEREARERISPIVYMF